MQLRYVGPGVDAGEMDVYTFAANMVALSHFVVQAAKATYGNEAHATAKVAGVSRGSFITELVVLVGNVSSLLSVPSASDLLAVIGQTVETWRHLQGEKPKSVKTQSDGVHIENNNGLVIIVREAAASTVFNATAATAVEQFVQHALKPGVDSVQLSGEADGKTVELATISQRESGYFVPVSPERDLFDQTVEQALIIEAPVFKDGNKWRFSDGAVSFHAAIEDQEFLNRVEAGELFAKGDVLMVALRQRQREIGKDISTERTVVLVREHRRGQSQINLWSQLPR